MVEASDNTVRDLAHRILARPEYAAARPGTAQTWIESIIKRISEWLNGMQAVHANSPLLFWLVLSALFLISALLIAHIVWTISAAMRAPVPAQFSAAEPPLSDPAAEARLLAAEGRYLEAAHRLMVASFRTLAERSIIQLRPDHSNRWIRHALRDSELNADLAVKIDGLVATTERHWFGDRENTSAIYSEWLSTFDELGRVTK